MDNYYQIIDGTPQLVVNSTVRSTAAGSTYLVEPAPPAEIVEAARADDQDAGYEIDVNYPLFCAAGHAHRVPHTIKVKL